MNTIKFSPPETTTSLRCSTGRVLVVLAKFSSMFIVTGIGQPFPWNEILAADHTVSLKFYIVPSSEAHFHFKHSILHLSKPYVKLVH